MEEIKDIERFISVGYVGCFGHGDGSGWGDGFGYADGSGFGDGSGYSSGDDDGSGRGSGYIDGDGLGYGSGFGNVEGFGDGRGTYLELISFKGQKVYYIDGIHTVIERVHGNLAKGYIVNNDLTTEDCYIAKHLNLFAHGKTAKDAERVLQDKIYKNMEVDKKISAFLSEFKTDVKYPAKAFYEWHHKLTGSCEFGRQVFVKNHGIDLNGGMYTVREFIEITKYAFGGNIIMQIAERIGQS